MASPSQVVSDLKELIQKSQALQAPAQSISVENGPLIVIGQGPYSQIVTGLDDIVSTATTTVAHMKGTSPVAEGGDSNAIHSAYREAGTFL